jgi:hypothetical protein
MVFLTLTSVNKLVKFELKEKTYFLEKEKKIDMYCILDLHFTI